MFELSIFHNFSSGSAYFTHTLNIQYFLVVDLAHPFVGGVKLGNLPINLLFSGNIC